MEEKVTSPKPKKIKTPTYLDFTFKEIPELEDYDVGEEVSLIISGKISEKRIYDKITESEFRESGVRIQIKKGEILNKKENRLKAEEMGLDKKDIDEIEQKRKEKKGG